MTVQMCALVIVSSVAGRQTYWCIDDQGGFDVVIVSLKNLNSTHTWKNRHQIDIVICTNMDGGHVHLVPVL
jgi:hypothetical protein